MDKINLVVNWHLLEPCNFHCGFCYAEWHKSKKLPLIYKDEKLSQKLITEIASLSNGRESVRLSLAGGEPLLDENIVQKIDFAKKHPLNVSIITNGDLLSERINETDLPKLSMLGVSIDSFVDSTNRKIGRCTKDGRLPDYDEIIEFLHRARKINPELKLKINTVVNPFNWNEDLSADIEKINPDKWKIMRVLPSTIKSRTQKITDEQFATFKAKHQHLPFAQFEDNEDMLHSYLMLEPYGRFFFNKGKEQNEYGYSDPIIDVGIDVALQQIKFDKDKFVERYDGEVV